MTNVKTKLLKLEEQKKELLEEIKDHIFQILVSTNSITIDEKLLVGFLTFAMNPANKDSPILSQMREVGKKHKIPSPTRPYNKKPKKNN